MYECVICSFCLVCQAKDEALSGKVERLVTWKWEEYPVKSEGEEELEDDVMAGEGGKEGGGWGKGGEIGRGKEEGGRIG